MGRTKLARMLLAAGSFPKARTPEGFEAIQVAALTANPDLVRESVLAFLSETDAAFERRLPALQRALAALPDFVMRITWEFSSWVPLVSRMLPSDTWNVSKRGSSLRLDSTLLGMNGLAWERGSVSLILWGSDMPRPGATFVLDNEAKTAADARMAFNHPQDMHIQDWVRKLLTQKQKTTDFWTRDVAFTPVLKKGLLSSLGSKLGRLAFGESAPRGRLTDPRSPPASAGSGSAAGGDDGEEGAVSASMSSFLSGAPASPAAAPASPAAEAITHVPNPQQVKEDVGVWSDCVAYEMRNLCIRDLTHAPILPELKLASWWKPEYSRQATAAEVAEAEAAAKGPVAGEGAAGAGAASPAAAAAASPLVDDAPEKRLGPLLRAIQAIRSGKINERNAASATVEELEGMGFEGEGGAKVTAGHTVESVSFAEYWGYEAPAGSTHKPTGAVAVFKEDALTVEDKSLDLKVLFSPEFPITVRSRVAGLPVLLLLLGVLVVSPVGWKYLADGSPSGVVTALTIHSCHPRHSLPAGAISQTSPIPWPPSSSYS